MPENSTGKSSSVNGDNRNVPPWLRRRVTRGLPSPLVSACLASAALGLAACAGPASTQALPASAGTVSARSAAPTTAPPASSASATGSTRHGGSRDPAQPERGALPNPARLGEPGPSRCPIAAARFQRRGLDRAENRPSGARDRP